MVDTLLQNVISQVEINGSLTKPISLQRLIREGFPLSLMLFVIASKAIYYLVRDNLFSPKVKGITLLDGSELIKKHFVDDTNLFMRLEEENISRLMQNLKIFHKA